MHAKSQRVVGGIRYGTVEAPAGRSGPALPTPLADLLALRFRSQIAERRVISAGFSLHNPYIPLDHSVCFDLTLYRSLCISFFYSPRTRETEPGIGGALHAEMRDCYLAYSILVDSCLDAVQNAEYG